MKLDRAALYWSVLAAATSMLPLVLLLRPSSQMLVGACFGIGAIAALSGRRVPLILRLALIGAAAITVFWLFGVGFGARTFGRDAGSVLLASMLGLKLFELGSIRDGRSVASFSLFSLMSAFLQDQGPMTLLLSLLAGGCIVAALGRLAECESPSEQPTSWLGDVRRRSATVGRIAAYSLPLALIGFFLIPRLASPLWGLPSNSNEARTGLSELMSPGDFASLYADDSPVLRVTFPDGVPAQNELYFRGPVLSEFDGRSWTRSYWSRSGESVLGDGGREIEHEIEQEPTDRRYLLALDVPGAAPSDAFLNRDRSVMVREPQSKLRRTRFVSRVGARLDPELPRTLRDAFSRLPEDFNPRTRALIAGWRAEDARPEALIQRTLDLFNAEFTYTLEPGLLGRNSVDDFLFETRRGYCEHFAAAFVVMMREAGLPARVVTGYLGGVVNPIGNYLIVRQSDAHAWAEVWFDGRGWIRVDPTNAVSPERIERGTDALAPPSSLAIWARPLLNAADWLRRGWNDYLLGFNAARQRDLLSPLGLEYADWRQIGMVLAVMAAMAVGLTLYFLLRPVRDPRGPVVEAFGRFADRLARRGAARRPDETPRQFAERVAGLHGDPEGIRALCERYHRWAYAAAAASPEIDEELARALRRYRPRRRAA